MYFSRSFLWWSPLVAESQHGLIVCFRWVFLLVYVDLFVFLYNKTQQQYKNESEGGVEEKPRCGAAVVSRTGGSVSVQQCSRAAALSLYVICTEKTHVLLIFIREDGFLGLWTCGPHPFSPLLSLHLCSPPETSEKQNKTITGNTLLSVLGGVFPQQMCLLQTSSPHAAVLSVSTYRLGAAPPACTRTGPY